MLCSACTDVLEKGRNFLYSSIQSGFNEEKGESGEESGDEREERQVGDQTKEDKSESRRYDDKEVAVHGHHRTFAGLQAAAEDWCHVCRIFWDSLSGVERQVARDAIAREPDPAKAENGPSFVTQAYVIPWPELMFNLKIRFNRAAAPGLRTRSDFMLYPDRGCPIRVDLTSGGADISIGEHTAVRDELPSSNSTLSESSLRLAKQWLGDCLGHSACTEGTIPWFPTRLLDLNPDIPYAHDCVRLVTTRETMPSQPYITLSHRWGTATFIQLTCSNIDSFQNGIPVKDMPKTFRDAVYVSRQLGARYLWIDSLCIIQNNPSDWARESSRMHLVYTNSYCNLAASDSLDSSGGLERERHPSMVQTSRVALVPHKPHYDGNGPSTYILEKRDLFHQEVSNCTLHERAWVLQERLLAPRVLHFSRYQLYWECRSCAKCEKYPQGITSEDFPHELEFIKRQDIFKKSDATRFYEFWDNMVWTYSRTFLTFSSDKLVALSGLAKIFSSAANDEYVAGLWRSNFELQLMWQRAKPDLGHDITRPSPYRAPSWSWASLDGPIVVPTLLRGDLPSNVKVDIRAEDIHLEYASNDDTGQILGGWLDLSGRLKPARLVCDERMQQGSPYRWGTICDDDQKEAFKTILDEPLVDTMTMMQFSDAGDLFCMPIVFPEWERSPGSEGGFCLSHIDWYYGHFLLFRIVDRQSNGFCRIGVGSSFHGRTDIALLHKNLDEEVKRMLPCLRYEHGRHTIRII